MNRYTKLSIVLLTLVFIGVGFRYHQTHTTESAIARFHDRSHDTALLNRTNKSLDAQLKEATTSLSSSFANLNLSITKPENKSTCDEGDPSLYKYSCYTASHLKPSRENDPPFSASDATKRLQTFDKAMASKAWSAQSSGRTQTSSRDEWNDLLAQNETVNLNYTKGDCMLYFPFSTQAWNSDGELSCADDLLPGFYY